jgi:alkyl sulfatase BDS1-like metallo-beta-lactamase superfamily hydrolase
MRLIERDRGVLIDPPISMETAAAAAKLYRQHCGDRR